MSKNSSSKLVLESITTAGRVSVRDYGRSPCRYQVTIYCAAARKMMTTQYFEREEKALEHARKWLAVNPGTEILQAGAAAVMAAGGLVS